MQTQTCGLPSGARSRVRPVCDQYVQGRIGELNLLSGCYSFFEAGR